MTSLPERLRRSEPRELVRTATSSPSRTRSLPSRRSDVSIRLPPRSDRDERPLHGGMGRVETRKTGRPYFSSQASPSVIIFTSLPPLSGFRKIVSSASPRLRFSIAEAGVIRSLPWLVQPWALRFADNSALTLFTVRLALESKLFNKRFVIDVRRIFCQRQILNVELILRRLRRGLFTWLSR